MQSPDIESLRSKRRLNRGVSVNRPYLESRKHKRAKKRSDVNSAFGGFQESNFYLEPAQTKKKSWNNHECRGGGSIRFW